MTALESFMDRKEAIDTLIANLTELSEEHFNVSPDELNWGHVGELGYIEQRLKEVLEFAQN